MYLWLGNGCMWQQNLYKRTWWGVRGETWTLRNLRRRFNVLQLSTVSRMFPENFWMFWWPSMHLVCAINFPNFPKFVISTLEKNFATPYLCCLYYFFSPCARVRGMIKIFRIPRVFTHAKNNVFSCIYAVHNIEFCFWFALWYRYYFLLLTPYLFFDFTKNSVNSCSVDYLHHHRLKK